MSNQPQFYVGYMHFKLGDLYRGLKKIGVSYVLVEDINPERDAKAAPENAEWFRYYQKGMWGYKPIKGPSYILDTHPVVWVEARRDKPAMWEVVLRHSNVRLPMHTGPTGDRVISSR